MSIALSIERLPILTDPAMHPKLRGQAAVSQRTGALWIEPSKELKGGADLTGTTSLDGE